VTAVIAESRYSAVAVLAEPDSAGRHSDEGGHRPSRRPPPCSLPRRGWWQAPRPVGAICRIRPVSL